MKALMILCANCCIRTPHFIINNIERKGIRVRCSVCGRSRGWIRKHNFQEVEI